MTISREILDELLRGVERPEDLLGDAGLDHAPPAEDVSGPAQACVHRRNRREDKPDPAAGTCADRREVLQHRALRQMADTDLHCRIDAKRTDRALCYRRGHERPGFRHLYRNPTRAGARPRHRRHSRQPDHPQNRQQLKMAFSKLKAHLRRIGARTFGALVEALGNICDLFHPQECWKFIKAAGYASD